MYTAPTYEAKIWWNDWHWNDLAALRSFVIGIEGAWAVARDLDASNGLCKRLFFVFGGLSMPFVCLGRQYPRASNNLLCPSPWRVIGGVLRSASHVTRYERRRHELLRLADSITLALGER